MSNPLDIVGLCGSLRRASYNRAALRLAGASMPPGTTLEIVEWRDLPFFDGDVFAAGVPAPVMHLHERLKRADGIVIASPEYNFTIPGGLKNALDWLSRLPDHAFNQKPIALLSASGGLLGGARMQYDLRKAMLYLNALVLIKPEVFIGMAQTKFDADGHCTDETTRKFAADQMIAFERWVRGVARLHAA